YAIYLKNILRGDLGPSISFVGSSVQSLIWQHASATLLLNLLALSLVFIFASVLICTSLIDPGSCISRMASLVSMAIISTPTILLAPILILIFSVHLGWLPPAFLSSPLHYILPAIVLSLRPSVYLARNLVNVMEAEVQKDYVR